MPLAGAWFKVWIYLVFVFGWTLGARPRFDTSTDMGLVLVPADAEVDSVIFRLRATDQDADFPLVFEITATITPVVRIDNLPCTLYNKVCQANVILTRRLTPGRLHDFAVRVRDSKGDSNSMQATISVTNATTSRDKIFPHIPSLIMVPEDTRPGKELDYLLVRANQWSGKPVYIELWQPKELFTIRQRQTPSQTRGVITLIGELDFETQSMYTLTMYATDPYTEPGKDTRNIAGLNVVVIVQDVQDVPPIFTLAPPLTRINNSVQPGDVILRVHAEDGDKGVPREITYGLVSEGNPFTPFFNISETTGEIILARPLEDLTQITHVGAPVVLTIVAEELRRSTEEPPAQATVVDVGLLLGEPGNSPPYFESDNYIASIDENLEPGTVITFPEQYSTRVRDEDIGKAGVFALKLFNNNGTFEINPAVAERNADFIITVRDNTLIDYEMYKSLLFKIVAQEVGPATNLSASVPVTIFLKDVNDNPPVFDEESYEVTLSENVTAGTRVAQVHATDKDTGSFGVIQYTRIIGQGHEAFAMDPDTGLITVAMGSSLDRENAAKLQLSVEARDENGHGNRGVVPLIVNLLDVNDNAPVFEKDVYEFMLNADLSNFTSPAVIKAIDADAEPPNNEVRYELIHGNYENKFILDEITGELFLRSPISKVRRKKQSAYGNLATRLRKEFHSNHENPREILKTTIASNVTNSNNSRSENETIQESKELAIRRVKRADDDALFTLTARAYDLGVPHLSSVTQVRVLKAAGTEAHIVMFVVPGEHPDPGKTAETLATITGGRVTVQEIRPYVPQNQTDGTGSIGTVKKSIVVARVEQSGSESSLVDIEKIRQALAANGVGIISGTDATTGITTGVSGTKIPVDRNTGSSDVHTTIINKTITTIHNEEVTWYKAENEILFWLLIILGLLMLLAIAALIICCICPGCPFYMAPRKRRVHSSETLIVRSEGRPKRHLHRKQAAVVDASWIERKQAWSADPTRRNWQFNRRNTKNCGQASLPGDVVYISNHQNDVQANIESLRLRDGPIYDHTRRSRIDEQERMYLEDIEAQKVRDYEAAEADSLQRHELERGSEIRHGVDVYRYVEPDANEEEATVREQHFYREGNAEVLRLVTRGQVEDTDRAEERAHHATLIVDGKDILLRRFIEDQKTKHEMSIHGGQQDDVRSMESHHRAKEIQQQVQQEIILIPDRLEERRHMEEIGPNVQRLVLDHEYEESLKADGKEGQRQTQVRIDAADGIGERIQAKEHAQSVNVQTYSFHDIELARQNALLTRLLLEREARIVGGTVVDSTSYLETQSLPGQVAIATQTDRTAATQTERHVRSRSDNDESEDDAKHRKKKSKKRYDGESRRIRTLWMKSPIEEEGPCFDKRLSILRKKVKEVKEGRKVSLEPDVLREISDSLDGNGSSCRGDEEQTRTYKRSTEETSIRYKVLEDDDTPTSNELSNSNEERRVEKRDQRTVDKPETDVIESTSSQEEPAKGRVDIKLDEKSPKKESKHKTGQKKIESVVKPSFRILEREISILSKKLSKLGDKKVQDSTGSDSTTRGKLSQSKHEGTREGQKVKKSEEQSSQSSKPSVEEAPSTSKMSEDHLCQRKESTIAKTRQKLKYQQAHVMSTGSSEYDETFEKPRKQGPGSIQDNFRQRHATGSRTQHVKTKRPIERKDQKKSTSYDEHDSDRGKEATPKEGNKTIAGEKAGRQIMTRVPKLASTRREYVSEEFSTSTGSDRVDNKRDTRRDSDKKSSTTLETVVSRVSQRKVRRTREQAGEKCADDSGKDIQKEESERQAVMELAAQSKSRGNGKREERRPAVEPVAQKIIVERKVVLPAKEDEEVSFKDALKELSRQEDAIHERIQRHADDVDARREEVSKFEGLKEVVEEEVHRVRIERQGKLEESEEGGDNDKIDKNEDEMVSGTVLESKERLNDSRKVSDEEKGIEREDLVVKVREVLTDKVDIKRDTEERVEEGTGSDKREVERKIEVDAGTEEKKSEKVEGTANMQREVEQKVEDVTKIEGEAKKKLDDSVQKTEHISSFAEETDKKIEQIEDAPIKESEAIKSDTERSVEDIDSAKVNIEEKPEKPKGFEDYESSVQRPYTCEIVNIVAAAKGICEPDAESITLPQTITSREEPKSPAEKSPAQAASPEIPLHAAELKSESPPVSKSPQDKKSPEPSTSPLPVKTPSPPISKSPEDKQSPEPITSPKPTKTPTPPPVKSPAEKTPPILSPVKSPDEQMSAQSASPSPVTFEIRTVSKSPDEKQLPPSESVSPASEIRAATESLEGKQSPESTKRTSPTTPEFPSNRKSSDEKLKLSPGISPIGSRVPSGDESVDKKSSPQPPIATPVELQTSSISKSPEEEKLSGSVKSASPPISRDKTPDKDVSADSGTASPAAKPETSANDKDLSAIKLDDTTKISPVASQVLSPSKSSDEDVSKKDTLSASPQSIPDDKKQEKVTTLLSDEAMTKDEPEKKDRLPLADDPHDKQMEEKELSEASASTSPLKDTIEQSDQKEKRKSPERGENLQDESENVQERKASPEADETTQETDPPRSPDDKSSLRSPDSSTHKHPEKLESHQPPCKPSSPPSHKEQSLPGKQIVAGQVDHPSQEQMFAEKADETDEPHAEQLNSEEQSDKSPNAEGKQDRPSASAISEPTAETTSETVPETTSETAPETTSETAPETTSETAAETTSESNKGKQPEAAEKYTDVSHPIFTTVTDQLDDSDESDSSSDISRKTALNAGPYQTPRHRARKLSDRENIETEEEEEPEVDSLPPAESVDSKSLIEMEGDKVVELPVDEETCEREAKTEDPEGETISTKKKEEEVAGKDMSVDNLIEAVASASTTILLGDKAEREAASVNDKGTDRGQLDSKVDRKETVRELERGERTEVGSNGKENVPTASAVRQTSKSNPKARKTKKYETFKRAAREKRSSVEEVSDETKRDSSPGKITRGMRRRSQKAESEPERKRESEYTKRSRRKDEEDRTKQSQQKLMAEREKKSSGSGPDKSSSPPKAAAEIDTSKTQSKYMAWYKQTKDESERRRAEAKEEDDEQLPRWLRRSMRQRRSLEEKRKAEKTPEMTPRTRRKVKPLVNVESEQLKAIVRQGRKLRKAEGGRNEDPPVQIFATTPPKRPPDAKHHLVQHSEYKYEKMPAPFYLHPPPPPPHPSPQLSPEHFEPEASAECRQPEIDPGISVGLQGGTRLRHQQLLEKKSVFDIAYSEAAPSQLRSDSTTPPS